LQKARMIGVADINMSAGNVRALHLGVAAQAKIRVAVHEQLLIYRAVWIMTQGAAFAHRRMLKNKRTRLIAMALLAAFVLAGHGQSARRFDNIAAVRVMALPAIHMTLDHRMMLRQIKFRVNVEMALKAGGRFLVRVDDEIRASACLDVLAAGAVTGFAAGITNHRRIVKMNPRVRTGGKFPDDVPMAVRAGFIADVMRPGNFQRRNHCARRGGA